MSQIEQPLTQPIMEKVEETIPHQETPTTTLPKHFGWKPETDIIIKGAELGILNQFINTIAMPEMKFSLDEFLSQSEKILISTQTITVLNTIFKRMQDSNQIFETKK